MAEHTVFLSLALYKNIKGLRVSATEGESTPGHVRATSNARITAHVYLHPRMLIHGDDGQVYTALRFSPEHV